MRKLTGMICVLALSFASTPTWAADPEDTLNQYFEILTSRDYERIGAIMDDENMQSLKRLMDAAMTETPSGVRLQRRVFGKQVSPEQIKAASADFYLHVLAGEVLKAADMQKFFVENRKTIGKLAEGDNIVHFVVRLYFRQGDHSVSDILVYTLIKYGDVWKMQFPQTIRQLLTLIEAEVQPAANPAS
jgi:hypothetical protein